MTKRIKPVDIEKKLFQYRDEKKMLEVLGKFDEAAFWLGIEINGFKIDLSTIFKRITLKTLMETMKPVAPEAFDFDTWDKMFWFVFLFFSDYQDSDVWVKKWLFY